MVIIIGLIVIIVVRSLMTLSDYEFLETVGSVLAVISAVLLAIALIILPLNYHATKAEVDRYHALQDTIENSRNVGASEIERAAIVKEISDYNKDLASTKYWNETIFDIFIYDGLAELDFLE